MEPAPRRVLLAGESWIMHTIHQKGFDSFTTTAYGEGHRWLPAVPGGTRSASVTGRVRPPGTVVLGMVESMASAVHGGFRSSPT